MKSITIVLMSVLLSLSPLFSEEDSEGEELTRLVVLSLENGNVIPAQATTMTKLVREAFKLTGMYYVLTPDEISTRLNAIGSKLPSECHTEKCALDAAQLLATSKVVVGELDSDNSVTILKLKLFDLESRNFESRVQIAAKCSKEDWNQLAKAGANKLLGMETSNLTIEIVKYLGKEVNHKKEWIIAGGVTVAAAFIYGMVNGSLSPSGSQNENITEVASYNSGTLANSSGAFADIPYSARAHGMGGAFVGLSDDANGMAYNPAGIIRAKKRCATAGYMQGEYGEISIPYVYTGYLNKITRTMAHGQALITSSNSQIGSNETQIITSFAKKFDDLGNNLRPFAVGVNLKFLMNTAFKAENEVYAFSDYAVEGGGFGLSLDLGFQFELSERITAGLLFKDLLNTIKYKNISTDSSYSEGLPQNIIIGGHYRIFNTMNLVLDGNKSLYLDTEDYIRLGMEKWLFNRVFAFRLGMSQNFSMDSHRKYHCGLGLDWEFKRSRSRIGVDYSYEYFPIEESNYMDLSGSQRFALNYKF